MTTACLKFDEWMSAGDLQQLELHAAECAGCRDELGIWNEISGVARTLQAEWHSPALESSIRRGARVVPFQRRSERWALAAAIILMVGLGAVTWRVVSGSSPTHVDRVAQTVDELETVKAQYARSIERLETLAEPSLETKTPLVVSYREKLMLLDDAIAECEANIEMNRRNVYLQKQLFSLYDAKRRTLQGLVRENPNVQ